MYPGRAFFALFIIFQAYSWSSPVSVAQRCQLDTPLELTQQSARSGGPTKIEATCFFSEICNSSPMDSPCIPGIINDARHLAHRSH